MYKEHVTKKSSPIHDKHYEQTRKRGALLKTKQPTTKTVHNSEKN